MTVTMRNTGLLTIGLGALAIWYLTRTPGPKWPVGTDLGHGITVQSATLTNGVWMYVLEFSEGGTAGPWTQAQVEEHLAQY